MEYFDRIVEAYEGLMGESFQQKSQRRIDWICDQVQGSKVLDIGCSQGICEVLLGRRGFHVTGIDRAQESIAYARKRIDQEPFDVRLRVRLLCADFIGEVELDDKYDTVLLTEILEHLEDPKEMVKRAADFLCSGGKMIITVPFGINEFPDHKQTFYMANISEILSEWVRIDQVEYMGEWIGFCCTKADRATPLENIELPLVLQEEKMFFALERALRDSLKSSKAQEKQAVEARKLISKMSGKYELLRQELEKMRIANGNLLKERDAYVEERDAYAKERDAYAKERDAYAKERDACAKERDAYAKERDAYAKERDACAKERNFYSEQYSLLAHAKLGRLTLKYWRIKDWFLARYYKKRVTQQEQLPEPIAQQEQLPEIIAQQEQLPEPIVQQEQLPEIITQPVEGKEETDLPSISVIIPTYKNNLYIKGAVKSVLKQNYPPEKIQIILSVNGDNPAFYDALCNQYKDESRITIVYTDKKGAGAARNYAIPYVTSECITFLDDDDYFEANYLKSMAQHMTGTVTMVLGCFVDFLLDSNAYQKENYINRALQTVGEGVGTDYKQIEGLLATICGKLYKLSLWTQFKQIDETLRNSEDVVFWADNCERLKGSYYTCGCKDGCGYVRRKVESSLSRPNQENYFNFYVQDRIAVIERLSDALVASKTVKAKNFIRKKINVQTNFMVEAFQNFSMEEKRSAIQCIQRSTALFLNRSRFGLQNGIAFCHNFSPASDPSAYVATKRINQISEREGLINWTVICADMRNFRSSDEQFEQYYAFYNYTKKIVVDENVGWDRKTQYIWGNAACETVEKESIDNVTTIYSRSLWVGSHIAAYLYKKKHPEVKWYAEFSDPLYMGIDNMPRLTQTLEGEDEWLNDFWHKMEKIVYENADVIIYTNDNQRKYMLDYYPEKDICKRAYERSLVMQHPVISQRYCSIFSADLDLNPEYIHIAYFGAFYTSRRPDRLWDLLKNERVMLHLFISVAGNLENIGELPERVQRHQQLNHLEFLNAASQMDYLVINDLKFPVPEINPYLPSKLADYMTSGTPIIALTYEGSPLSKMTHPSILRIEGEDTIQNLQKKKTCSNS